MYWRMLSKNPELARRVVLSERPTISDDSFATQPRLLDRLVANLCTLSSVYHQPPEDFLNSTASKQGGEDDDDEDDEDDEEAREAVERARHEMNAKRGETYVEDSDDESDGSKSSSSGSSDGAGKSANGRTGDGKAGDSNGPGASPPPPLRP